MVTPTAEMCISCKGGKALCGEPCILLARIDARLPKLRLTSQDVAGTSPPAVFVGRYGYPKVNLGPLLPPIHLEASRAASLDDPSAMLATSIQDVLGMRSSLVRTRALFDVQAANAPPPLLNVAQELALSARPVDTEVHLVKKPNLELTARVNDVVAPMGPAVDADRARLTQNARVERLVDRATQDVHAKAAVLMRELYDQGLPPHKIHPLLSVGLLGRTGDRRLVPTRWSITATDDQIGLTLIPPLLTAPTIDRFEYYHDRLHGNEFHVVLLPTSWSFNLMEVWMKGAMWALETSPVKQDYEDARGRTHYADVTAGAYYAARLSALEHLTQRRRQAAVLVYREITPDYWAPLGVWVIREAVKRALAQAPQTFDTSDAALAFAESRTRNRGWSRLSRLVSEMRTQRRLGDFR